MRTFKYTYLDAKGNTMESTVEADDKDDAYIILKTMRINPVTITQTEAEDISLEVIGAREEQKERRPAINYGRRPASSGKAPARKAKDEIDLEAVVSVDELRRVEVPKVKKKKVDRPPYEMFALFCAGVVLLGWSAWATARDSAHLDWPIARGFVWYSDVLVSGIFEKEYKPDIRYRYSVNGQKYIGTNVFSGTIEGGRTEMTRLLRRHPVGQRVFVYYDPDRPEESYLESVGASASHALSAILGMLCFAAATGMFVVAKINEPPKPKEKAKPAPGATPKKPDIEITSWSAHVK